MRSQRSFVAIIGLIAAASAAALVQEPKPSPSPNAKGQTPSFPSQIEQVIVDVVVTDKKGVPIPNLNQSDFTVLEDGKPQELQSFERVVLPERPPQPTPTPPPKISVNTDEDVKTGRTFVIVFDDIHMAPFQAHRAKGAVSEFLKSGVQEGDRVTLLASGGAAWWSTRMLDGRGELLALLKRLDGRNIPDMSPERMSDYEAMRIHVYRDNQVADRVARRYQTFGVNPGSQSQPSQAVGSAADGDPMVMGKASEVYFQAVTKNRITLEVVERALGAMVGTKGRKSMILVSEGFIYDPNMDEFKRVVQASRRANVAIYFLDTRGLQGASVYATAQFGPSIDTQDIGASFAENIEASEGSESLSADSGGFTVKNTNDLAKGIKRIADETRSYYLVGYNPSNLTRDGRFRKITVKVAGKNLEVRARKGYYAPLDGAKTALDNKKKAGPDPAFQAALDSPFEEPAVPMRMTSHVFDETLLGKANVVVSADVDLASFAFEAKEGRFVDTLEFLMVVAHRESGEYFRYDQKYDMKLLPATREKLRTQWYPVSKDFELAPGAYQAKLVVRDKNASTIGTVIHNFEVPDLTQFRTSSLVLTDTLQTPQDGSGDSRPKPAVVARRTFKNTGMIYCQFDVFGMAKDKKTGMPIVSAGYIVRKKEGEKEGDVFVGVQPTKIQPTSLGRLSRMVGTKLEGAAPGTYELVLTVKDEVSGKALQVAEEFSVVG